MAKVSNASNVTFWAVGQSIEVAAVNRLSSLIFGPVYMLLFLLGVVGNVVILPTILSTSELLALPAYKLIVSLGIADCFILFCAAHVFITQLAGKEIIWNDRTAGIWNGGVIYMLWFVYLWHILMIAINRFVYVVLPQLKAIIYGGRRTLGIILIAWIGGFAMYLPHLLPGGSKLIYYPDHCVYTYDFFNPPSDSYKFYQKILNYVYMTVLPLFYIPILIKLRLVKRRVVNAVLSRQEIKLTLQFFCQCVHLAVSVIFWHQIPVLAKTMDPFLAGCLSVFIFISLSVVDPWIYLAVNTKLRQIVIHRLCCLPAVNLNSTNRAGSSANNNRSPRMPGRNSNVETARQTLLISNAASVLRSCDSSRL